MRQASIERELALQLTLTPTNFLTTDLSRVTADGDSAGIESGGKSSNGSGRFDIEQSLFLDKENNCVLTSAGGDTKESCPAERPIPLTPPVPDGFSGFPNGNSKYNERKGITTFCTPFEERIERALRDLDDNII